MAVCRYTAPQKGRVRICEDGKALMGLTAIIESSRPVGAHADKHIISKGRRCISAVLCTIRPSRVGRTALACKDSQKGGAPLVGG